MKGEAEACGSCGGPPARVSALSPAPASVGRGSALHRGSWVDPARLDKRACGEFPGTRWTGALWLEGETAP